MMRSTRKYFKIIILVALSLMVSSCADWEGLKGVNNTWRQESLPPIELGKTHQSDITSMLGPPSQIISQGENTIFYYLLEQKTGKGIFIIIYNHARIETLYDRAIFFFDSQGVLTDYSYSHEEIVRGE